MKRRLLVAAMAVVAVSLVVIACSSSDPYEQPPQSYGRPSMGGGGSRGGFAAPNAGDQILGAGLDMLAEASWWRDPRVATEVAVTPEQVTALDKIESEHATEIARLLRDTQGTVRELRDALNAEPANQDAIVAAGQRVRSMRDATLDHVVKMLAAERQLLSHQQWTALQTAVQERRQQRQQERGFGGRGGRGMGGGVGGRRPGGGF